MSGRKMSLKRKKSSASSSYADDKVPVLPLHSKYAENHSAAEGHDDLHSDFIGADIRITAAASGVVPDDTFTVTQAVNSLGFGRFQIILSFVTGLCWMADSMEIMILSILSPALHCEWGVSQYRQAFLTTVVFVGMMLSSAFWGRLSDKYGRRRSLILSGIYLFFYGLLSSFVTSYPWILFLRFMVGFSIGCVPQSVTLFAEFLPTKQRAKCVVLLDCFWAFGACLEVLLAALIMPLGGWRWLLALSSLPSLVFVLTAAAWLPESARYNAASGHSDEALETLERIASDNGKPMLLGRLIVEDEVHLYSRGRVRDLLNRDLRKTTLLLWLIWTGCSFIYYGVVLMTTELYETPGDDVCALNGQLEKTCSAQCRELDRVDYTHLLWTTLAEFPGIMITIMMIEKLGRKMTMASEFLLLTVALCFLFNCGSNRTLLTVMLFFIRVLASGVFQAAYVYTPEVYPTVLRSVGVGSCSGMARLGAMLTPYIAQVLMKESLSLAVAVYVAVSLIAAVACMMLPVETRGKDLVDGKSHAAATK